MCQTLLRRPAKHSIKLMFYPYRAESLFPFLIEQGRKEQAQGDFSFYWVQLADFKPEKPLTPFRTDAYPMTTAPQTN